MSRKMSPHKRALSREDRKLSIKERRAKGDKIRKDGKANS